MTTENNNEINEINEIDNNFIFNVLDWYEFDEIPYEDENNSDSENDSLNSNKKKYVKESNKKYFIKIFYSIY